MTHKTPQLRRQRGWTVVDTVVTVLAFALLGIGMKVYIDMDLKQRQGELNRAIENHLGAFTYRLESHAGASVFDDAPTPADGSPVSAEIVADLYYFCSTLREQDESYIVRRVRYPAFARHMAEVAQACSNMAGQVAKKTFSHGQLRAAATLQRQRFVVAAAAAAVERNRIDMERVADMQARNIKDAPERMSTLQDWGKN
jgi:hypothetical protein